MIYRRYRGSERQIERRDIHLTIFSVLVAFLTDALMNSVTSTVASTRQEYLVEFGRYLDARGLPERPK